MNLLELRKKFIFISGRYDLVVDAEDWKDNGADAYLNAAARYLNRRVNIPTNFAKTGILLSPGCDSIVYSACRAVQQISVFSDREYPLRYDANLSQNGLGLPSAFKYCTFQHLPKISEIDISAYPLEQLNVLIEPCNYVNGIQLDKKADRPYLLTIYGIYHNTDLKQDSDVNYWSIEYPNLLLKAAMYELEVIYRNREGSNTWLEAIEVDLAALDNDLVEHEMLIANSAVL